MKVLRILLHFAALLCGANAFIIPDQLVSLLTLVYSTIPPVEKGTDSRFGVGFRLGPFADLQLLFELGPQRYTQPIGVVGNSINPGKRFTPPIDPFELQRLEKAHSDRESRSRSSFQSTNSVTSDPVAERSKAWLSRWRSSLAAPAAPVAVEVPGAAPVEPVAPAAIIQPMAPVQRTPKTSGHSESKASSAGYRQQAIPVWNYSKLQRLRQLYAMAAKGR